MKVITNVTSENISPIIKKDIVYILNFIIKSNKKILLFLNIVLTIVRIIDIM